MRTEIVLTENKHKKLEAIITDFYVSIVCTDKQLQEMGDETAVQSVTLEKHELQEILDNMPETDENDFEIDESMDGDFDSTMKSCGWGTDEDYSMGEML